MGTSGTNQENPQGSNKLDYLEKAPQPKLTPSDAPQRLRAVFCTEPVCEWKMTRAGSSCRLKPIHIHCVKGFGSNCPQGRSIRLRGASWWGGQLGMQRVATWTWLYPGQA